MPVEIRVGERLLGDEALAIGAQRTAHHKALQPALEQVVVRGVRTEPIAHLLDRGGFACGGEQAGVAQHGRRVRDGEFFQHRPAFCIAAHVHTDRRLRRLPGQRRDQPFPGVSAIGTRRDAGA